ncbi:hypothetical protein RND81_12G158500 [Saponaria officinalis]|uniref:Calmodulin-binding protein n=1 Tax=Saponaria officinalis TaxID=3572 RepID=A0AAW1HB49_SAPOF
MVFKRYFGDDGSNKSPHSNYSQTSTNKFQKAVKYVMEEAFVQEMVEKIAMRLEPTFRKVVKEELEYAVARSPSSLRQSLVHQHETIPPRELQLVFTQKIRSPLFTNTRIEDDEHNLLQVQLIDANSNNVIQNGKQSSIKVEIVVINADFVADGRENWTETEFKDNIVRQREGKRPLLIGDLRVELVNGIGSLENVSFTDNSSWTRSGKFKLGVRAMSSGSVIGCDVKEAVSEVFVVLDHRGESTQKHSKPSLDDPVWRLRKILKQGVSHKKLDAHGIKTVKDFLMHYYTNPSSLRNVLGKGVANKAWDTMVRHANECDLDSTYYRYCDESNSVELLFNCVYKVITVKFAGHNYQTLDFLDSRQKALVEKLKHSALQNVNELVQVHSSMVIPPVELPSIGHNISFSSSQLDLHNGFSMIDQDKPAKEFDFNLSDTASYPCTGTGTGTAEEDYLPEGDSASQTNPPIPVHGFSHPTFIMTGNSSSVPSDGGYNWFVNSPGTTCAHNINPFGELSHPQTAQMYPLGATWGQDSDVFTTSTLTAHHGMPWQMPDYSIKISGSGSRSFKAGWCKIRAAVMWKIVRRTIAARRKAKFTFS